MKNYCSPEEEQSNSTASVSLDGHFGSMTSWICVTPLLLSVFLSRIDLSEGNCYNYFDIEYWKDHLSDRASVIETSPEDVMECSLERESQKSAMNKTLRYILFHCFRGEETHGPITTSEKCKGNSSKSVPFYTFRCLLAKAAEINLTECDFKTTCELYKSLGQYQTSTLPPTTTSRTTLPERTTAPTTTLSPTTTTLLPTTTTTLSPTTTAPTTLPEKTASTASSRASTAAFQSTASDGERSPQKGGAESSVQLKIFLIISVSLNLLLPLAVYLYMRRQRTIAVSREWINGTVLDRGSAESIAELQSEILLTGIRVMPA